MENKLPVATTPEDEKKLGDLLEKAGAPPGTKTKFTGWADPKYLGPLDQSKVENILAQAAAESQPSTSPK